MHRNHKQRQIQTSSYIWIDQAGLATCNEKTRSTTCNEKTRRTTCSEKTRRTTCSEKTRRTTCNEKTRSTTCNEKTRSTTCSEKTRRTTNTLLSRREKRENGCITIPDIDKDKQHRRTEKISDIVRTKRSMTRLHFTLVVKRDQLLKLETVAQTAEQKLNTAQRLLHQDEEKFNAFLKDYMNSAMKGDSEVERQNSETQQSRKEIERQMRDMKLKISTLQQSLWELEETAKDQLDLKALLEKENVSSSQGKSIATPQREDSVTPRDTPRDSVNALDILDFVIKFLNLEESNFQLMRDIQRKEVKLVELNKRVMRFLVKH